MLTLPSGEQQEGRDFGRQGLASWSVLRVHGDEEGGFREERKADRIKLDQLNAALRPAKWP